MSPEPAIPQEILHLLRHMTGCMKCPVPSLNALVPDMVPKGPDQESDLRHMAGHVGRDCLRCEGVLRRYPKLAEHTPKLTGDADLEHVFAHMAGCAECAVIKGRLPPDLYARTPSEEADMRHVVTHIRDCYHFRYLLDRRSHLVSYLSLPNEAPVTAEHVPAATPPLPEQVPAATPSTEQVRTATAPSEDPDLAHITTHMRGCSRCAEVMSPGGQARGGDDDALRHVMTHMNDCQMCAEIIVRNEAFAALKAPPPPIQQEQAVVANMTTVDTSDERGRGRPPKDKTANGMTMLRFEVPAETAEVIRSMARATDQDIMPFLARTVCQALGLPIPVPQKRGPKPKQAQAP